jgi:hypothetical protein
MNTVQFSKSLIAKSRPFRSPGLFTSISFYFDLNMKSALFNFFFFAIDCVGYGAELLIIWLGGMLYGTAIGIIYGIVIGSGYLFVVFRLSFYLNIRSASSAVVLISKDITP